MPPPRRPKQWRASPEVVRILEDARSNAIGKRPEVVSFVDAVAPAIRQAVARGAPLAVDPQARPPTTRAAPAPRRGATTGAVFVLTDGACFSSCILVLNRLKAMGARHVGEASDRNAIYGENWFEGLLPSRLGRVSLPLAIFGMSEAELGGAPPDLPWTGAADDQAGLAAFIAAAAATR
jgi:hypothetical protein